MGNNSARSVQSIIDFLARARMRIGLVETKPVRRDDPRKKLVPLLNDQQIAAVERESQGRSYTYVKTEYLIDLVKTYREYHHLQKEPSSERKKSV